KAGPMGSGANAIPFDAAFTLAHLDLASSGLIKPSSGISGVVSADGSASASGQLTRGKARLKAEKWRLDPHGAPAARALDLDCAIEHDSAKRSGRLTRGNIHVGKAAASLTGTYNAQGASPAVNMRFAGNNMPLAEIAAVLPALNITLPAGSSIE